MRDCPVSALSAAHVKMLRDRKTDKPGAANNRRKYLSSLFGWVVEQGLMRSNPAREVRRVRYATAGFSIRGPLSRDVPRSRNATRSAPRSAWRSAYYYS